MTDTERLDALNDYGLCVATHDTLRHNEWQRTWVCQYGDRVMMGPTIRAVIDSAVLDIVTSGQRRN